MYRAYICSLPDNIQNVFLLIRMCEIIQDVKKRFKNSFVRTNLKATHVFICQGSKIMEFLGQ